MRVVAHTHTHGVCHRLRVTIENIASCHWYIIEDYMSKLPAAD